MWVNLSNATTYPFCSIVTGLSLEFMVVWQPQFFFTFEFYSGCFSKACLVNTKTLEWHASTPFTAPKYLSFKWEEHYQQAIKGNQGGFEDLSFGLVRSGLFLSLLSGKLLVSFKKTVESIHMQPGFILSGGVSQPNGSPALWHLCRIISALFKSRRRWVYLEQLKSLLVVSGYEDCFF